MKAQMRIRRDRRGFTLIELVVVLLVLAGLAGIIVPVFQNMLVRTHGAAGASNIAETAKALQMHVAEYGVYPDLFDSLTDGTAVIQNGFGEVEDQDADPPVDATPRIQASAATDYVEQFEKAGITAVVNHPASGGATFFSGPGVPLTTAQIAVLTTVGIAELGLPPTTSSDDPSARDTIAYVAMGVGGSNTAIGRTMVDAGVHFPEEGNESPESTYSRFIAVFAIPADGAARLATVAAAHEEGFSNISSHLGEYFESRN
jgi:prepilin-type N-terminal cleavage/methylation domain-containing protein